VTISPQSRGDLVAQVAIRNIRKSSLDKIKKMKKAIGEDAAKDAEETLQKAVKKYEEQIGKAVEQRDKEIMTI
jgi:ribosome recycling factor